MCDSPATTDEHVPPRCLFPVESEWRKQLIKVPSCELHNSKKSTDDELLRHYIASAGGNNELALQVYEPVIRSWERNPKLMKTFLYGIRPVQFGGIDTAAYSFDLTRWERAIGCIVRGLYFHEKNERLHHDLDVFWEALRRPNLGPSPFKLLFIAGAHLPANWKGANPRVFRYSFHEWQEPDNHLCRLQFYEGPPIYVAWGHLPDAPGESGSVC